MFNGLLETANNNKQHYRAQVSDVQFDDLSKYIEPNKLIKQQLTEKIAEINKYLLGIATNDMLKTLSADMNIIKSGFFSAVIHEQYAHCSFIICLSYCSKAFLSCCIPHL